MERIAIYIDGSNFYHKLKDPSIDGKNLTKFNYKAFCKWLCKDLDPVYVGYYIGVVKAKPDDERAVKLKNNQVSLFNELIKQELTIKKRSFNEKWRSVSRKRC